MTAGRTRGFGVALSRLALILLLLGTAAYAGWYYWRYQHVYPHTRDAYVRANVVGIAAQVEGPISRLLVSDNQQVRAGDLLFEIDPHPFAATAETARAKVKRWEAEVTLQQEEVDRYGALVKRKFVPKEKLDEVVAALRSAQAQLELARAELEEALLYLSYTQVSAPADGYVTNFLVRVGTYVYKGQQLFALVESRTWWISANYMETYLRRIRPGQRAEVTIDMYPGHVFAARVEGVSAGIYQVNGETTGYGLPLVGQTIDWVRLAQRFPVRVTLLDHDPERFPLRSGGNAEVTIHTDEAAEGNLWNPFWHPDQIRSE